METICPSNEYIEKAKVLPSEISERLLVKNRGRFAEKARERIKQAARKSLAICEFCGQPGALMCGTGVVVACAEHRSPGDIVMDLSEIFPEYKP